MRPPLEEQTFVARLW